MHERNSARPWMPICHVIKISDHTKCWSGESPHCWAAVSRAPEFVPEFHDVITMQERGQTAVTCPLHMVYEKQYSLNQTTCKGDVFSILEPDKPPSPPMRRPVMEPMIRPVQAPKAHHAPLHVETPRFINRPDDCVLVEGSSASFTCRVAGNPMPEVCWLKNTAQMKEGNR
jgi:hypothetical protein